MSSDDDSQSEAPPQRLSLDKLRGAFARMLRAGGEPPSQAETTPGEADASEPPAETRSDLDPPPATDEQDACPLSPATILEAMLFVGDREDRSLSAADAAALMRGVEPQDVPPMVDQLNRRYADHGCPYRIVHAGAGYRLSLHEKFYPLRNRFYGRIREARLSQAAVDVLAIVAYRQPLSSEQVSRLRGKPSSHVLAQLVRRGLLRVERRQSKPRIAEYYTTDRFLSLFNLDSLDDLPQAEELDR
jgi:segregation and condensation protein B